MTVTDSTANTAFPVTFHDGSNGLLEDTGTFTYNPSSGLLSLTSVTCSGLHTSGRLLITPTTDNNNSASSPTITIDFSTDGDHIYTLDSSAQTITFAASNISGVGRQGTIIIKHASANNVQTTSWNTSGYWYFEGGTAPSLSSENDAFDVFSYYIVDDGVSDKVLVSSASSFTSHTG